MSLVNNITTETQKEIEDNSNNWKNYVVISTLVWVSGNPPFRKIIVDKEITLISILLLFSVLFFFLPKKKKSIREVGVLTLFIAIGLYHTLDGGDIVSELGHIIRISIGCLAALILGNSFRLYFIKLMTWVGTWSLLLWLIQLLDFASIFNPLLRFLSNVYGLPQGYCLLYTFMIHSNEYYRNAGIFWEPGAYAGFLCIALMFLFSIRNSVSRSFYLYSLILMSVSLLTTLSTTGYIAFFIIIFYFMGLKNRKSTMFFILIPIVLLLSYYLYGSLSFLQNKIDIQIENTLYEKQSWQINRFGSFLFDLDYIIIKPLFGWGHNFDNMGFEIATFKEKMGNGFSGYILKNGIIGICIVLVSIYKNLKKIKIDYFPFVFVLMFCILLQGEVFLEYPFFLALAFFSFDTPTGDAFQEEISQPVVVVVPESANCNTYGMYSSKNGTHLNRENTF